MAFPRLPYLHLPVSVSIFYHCMDLGIKYVYSVTVVGSTFER